MIEIAGRRYKNWRTVFNNSHFTWGIRHKLGLPLLTDEEQGQIRRAPYTQATYDVRKKAIALGQIEARKLAYCKAAFLSLYPDYANSVVEYVPVGTK